MLYRTFPLTSRHFNIIRRLQQQSFGRRSAFSCH